MVSFRGSRNVRNWLADLDAALPNAVLAGAPADVRVHRGFLHTWVFLRDDVVRAVAALRERHPHYAVLVTGHSLGGAVAVLCAVHLAGAGLLATVVTLNQPRVGNTAFAQWTDTLGITLLRVVNQHDLVPHLPALWQGFRHAGTEIWIWDALGHTVACNAEAVSCSNSRTTHSIATHSTVWNMQLGVRACSR